MEFKKLADSDRISMIAEFSEDEVRRAVWECDSSKCPGPDGVNFGFIKEFWNILKGDFMRVLDEFHKYGRMVKGANSSFIVLIPKKTNPTKIADYRPVSLIGCIYKVISNVLANRLKKVMDSIISESQSAFISGRQILDGILVANEIVDEARRKRKEVVLFKVDFEKAFDSVDWNYLLYVMEKIGFHEKWRSWIAECLRSSSVSVLVNGNPTNEFTMGRGLKQGDPLSPFLFLLASEGFSTLMEKAKTSEKLVGFKFERGTRRFTHLQYADDTLIVCEKSWSNIRAIKYNLLLFEVMSGLKVNFNKSSIVGINVTSNWIAEAARIMNCKVKDLPMSYLGLPIGADPNRSTTWNHVIKTVKSRLSRWKTNALSIGGRVVLLKSVLSAIPVYFLSFFKAPTGVWSFISKWIGVQAAFHNDGWRHLEQVENLAAGGRAGRMKMIVIWSACVWNIWKSRNNKVFRNEEISIAKIGEESIITAWKWLKIKSNFIKEDLGVWCMNPKACLGISIN